MQRVFVSVVNAAACLFQKRVPSRVTGDVKKVHYRRHARTCVMCDLCQMARGMQGRLSGRAERPFLFRLPMVWHVVPKVNEDCAVHVRHAKEKVACRRRRFNRCVHIARSARIFFMFLRFGVILTKQRLRQAVWWPQTGCGCLCQNGQVEQWGYIIFRSTRLLSQTGHFLPALGL